MPRDQLDGDHRGYKAYRAAEFARIFAAYSGTLIDKTIDLTLDKQVVLAVWRVPQAEYHPVLISYLFSPAADYGYDHVVALAVYGSVARGEAKEDSDIDILAICDETVDPDDIPRTTVSVTGGRGQFEEERVISETWMTRGQFDDGLEAGSTFLRSALDETIVLYDPEDVIRGAR